MEKLAALQYLISAPSKSAVEKLVVLVFERRAGEFTPEELAALAKRFSLDDAQLAQLLVALRLLIRAALKRNVTIEQLAEALPESVDKRLRVLVLKIVAAHHDEWRAALDSQRTAAAASAAAPAPAEPVAPPVLPPVVPNAAAAAPAPAEPVLPPVLPPVVPEAAPAAAPAAAAAAAEKKKGKKAVQQQQQQQQADLEAVGAQRGVPTATRKVGPSLPRFEGIDWRVDVRSASDTVSRMSVPTVLVQMRVQNSYNGEVPPAEGQAVAQRLVTFELNKETLATMLDGLVFVRDQLASIAQ